jgi:hypothetical protein
MATNKPNVKKDDPNELIEFEAFYDDDKYKDDIYVAVNGRRFQIKRGEKVMIPRYVYEVIMNSEAQDKATARLMEQESTKFANESRALGYN